MRTRRTPPRSTSPATRPPGPSAPTRSPYALQQAADRGDFALDVVRNGSRGMLWLEPLVEVVTPQGRVGYGPVTPDDVDGAARRRHARRRRAPAAARPGRRTRRGWRARTGSPSPGSASPTRCRRDDYVAHGGLAGLRAALGLAPADVVAEVTDVRAARPRRRRLPGRHQVEDRRRRADELKFVCCNADEGDSGTFADRMLMEGDPFMLIEGMTIAAHAVGASEGYIYIRSEYPDAVATMRRRDRDRPRARLARHGHPRLRARLRPARPRRRRRLHLRRGDLHAGEPRGQARHGPRETADPGDRGPVRQADRGQQRPHPRHRARRSSPTARRPTQELGVDRSRGTQVFQLGGNIARGGIVETAFGITLRELVEDYGGGTRSGRPVRTVQVGGPLGAYLPTSMFDLPMDYEAFAAAGAMVGHGGVVVFDDTVDMAAQARFAMEFCAEESCGKCTPCRVGAVRGVEVIDRIVAGGDRDENLALLEDLCDLMTDGSLCAMGGLTPMPVRSALLHFPEDFLGPRTGPGDRLPAAERREDGGHA